MLFPKERKVAAMSEANGYAGEILQVDLSSGRVERVPTARYSDLYLGGRGFAAKLYWEKVPPRCGAFDADNCLVFATGPVSATTGFLGSRWQVGGKSPIHDRFSYCNLGGAWGAQLKFAGYDALVVRGKAEKPSYLLWIEDDKVEIRSAAHLTGKGAIARREAMKEELGQTVRVVAIGPAGENGVTFSTFVADSDSSGSSGLASVMGSKNLKAIAVRGSGKVGVADPEGVSQLKKEVLAVTGMPPKAFRTTSTMVSHDRLRHQICYDCVGCPIRTTYLGEDGKRAKFTCHSMVFYEVRAHRYYGQYNEVPYIANKLCDDYGMDSHGVETIIMWLNRCHRAGLLTDEQTGIPLSKIGSREFIEALTRKIAFREGFGDTRAPDGVGDPTLESRICKAVTGRSIDEQGLYRIGERVYNLQRAILAREGSKGRQSENLEDYNFTVPLKTDFGNPECLVPGKDGKPLSRRGMVLDREQFEKMKDEYYAIRGWDVPTGLQTRTKLEDLQMHEEADVMGKEGLLA